MSIANLENVISNAERRALLNREKTHRPAGLRPHARTPSSRGKLELTMSEDDGHEDKLISRLAGEAVKNVFDHHLDIKDFRAAVDYFEGGKGVEIGDMQAAARGPRQDREGPGPQEEGRRAGPRSACPT